MIIPRHRRSELYSILASACVLVACEAATDGNPVQIGSPAPEYAAITIDGDSVSLASQRGRVVLLNVWATWCRPCRAEIPELRELQSEYHDRGFDVLGVSVDAGGSEEAVREFVTEFAMVYPIWLDPDERVSTTFRTAGVPETFLIDRNGILRWRKLGPIERSDSTLAMAIERALPMRP
jgi:cytochrome c biogenesis protein CcmG, thiol:disulfide interchange protein DsbE